MKTPPAGRSDLLSLQPVGDRHAVQIPAVLAACAVAMGAVYLGLGKYDALNPGRLNPDVFRFLDLTEEANLPTWFSALLWQIAALLAFSAAQLHRARGWPHSGYWIGMVPIFLFLSIDEAGKVHETIGDMIGARVEMTGALRYTYAWVLFGLGFVAVVGLAYLRLLIRLRPSLAGLLVLSAVLFLTGAVGAESISASGHRGSIDALPPGLTWARLVFIEEILEMLGPILLIHVLLKILALEEPPYRKRAARALRTSD